MNLQKMYAVGHTIYVDMDKYQKRKTGLNLLDKEGNKLSYHPRKEVREQCSFVLKDHIAATKEQSLLIYDYRHANQKGNYN